MKLDKIPVRVLDELQTADYTDEEIEAMSPKEVFSAFCTWEGLIGWSDTLWDIQTELKREEPDEQSTKARFNSWAKLSKM